MNIRPAHAAVLSCVLLLGACATATPVHVPLAANARAAIASTEVVAPVRQSEIYVYVPPSQMARNGGGGLLLALIDAGVDSARTHNAEKDIKQLRDAAVDYDFDGALRNDLQSALSQVSFLHLDHARVIKDAMPANIDGAITSSKDTAVLIAQADYHLSNDGSELTMTMAADLFANSPALRSAKPPKGDAKLLSSPTNALYRNTFVFARTIPGASPKRDENVARWSADNGKMLREALNDGAAQLAGDLAQDIQQGPDAAASAPVKAGGR